MPLTVEKSWPLRRRATRSARGFALFYFLFGWSIFIGFCSLAVDFGRVSMVKSQLQCVADAAARAALYNLPQGVTTSQNAAVNIAAANNVDGSSVTVNANTDVTFGTWDPAAQTFTTLVGNQQSSANAIRVTIRRAAASGNAVPLLFGALVGQHTCDVHASSIACKATAIPLPNSDFESPALSYGSYVYNQVMTGWTLNGSCLETYGSAWGGPQPHGNQAISLQNNSNITTSFSAVGGVYSVSFLAAQRTAYYTGSGALNPVTVTIDGTLVTTISPTDGTFQTYTTPTITLSSGSHTLVLAGTNTTGDRTTFVDTVSINCSSGSVVLAN